MARFEFRLPDVGEGIAEAEIVAWHVKAGDTVDEDAPVVDVMTDKATVELSAPVSGAVLETHGEVGGTLAIGSVIAVFQTDVPQGTTTAPPEPEPPEAAGQRSNLRPPGARGAKVLASPAVRKRARGFGIDLSRVQPSGDGRIRHRDLEAFLGHAGKPEESSEGDRIETIKLTGLRRGVSKKMAESKRHIPHFSYVEEVDVTALEALRARMNAESGARPRLTPLPFLIRALVRVLPAFPAINARYDDAAEVVERHSAVHLGIATRTEGGLLVPVLRDAGRFDIHTLAGEVRRLAEGARAGRLSRDELSGSTITITSLGPLGGIVSTPIINRPEVAIIGVNRMVDRAVVVDGRIMVRKMMNLSSSFDHRVIDGWDAASFIQALKRLVEAPALIFTDED